MNDTKLVNGNRAELSDDEQAALDADRAAHAAALPARLAAGLAAHRYAVETGGITVAGLPVLTDDRSKLMINGALAAAQQNPAFTTKWKTPGGFVTLNAAQIIGAANAVAAHVSKCFSAEATVAANVINYASTAEVIAAFDAAMVE